MSKKIIFYSLLLIFYSGISCNQSPTYDLYIKNVNVVDLDNRQVQKASLLIKNGEIVKQAKASEFGNISAKKTIDAAGKYLIPGLWDSHVHLMEEANQKEKLSQFLEYGITSVRDAGGSLDSLREWDQQIQAGVLNGPDIYYAGPTLNGPKTGDAAYTVTVDTREAAEKIVNSFAKERVDFIKVHDQVNTDVLEQVTKTAKMHDLPVAGHVPFGTSIKDASQMGMTSFEHLSAMVASVFYQPDEPAENFVQAYGYLQGESGRQLFELLKANRTMVTPTLITYKKITEADEDESRRDMGERALKEQQNIVRYMNESGVKLLAGSDFGTPDLDIEAGKSLVEELILLSESGINNYEILKMATAHPAAFFGLADSTGLVKEGYRADLILLEQNPIEDISHVKSVTLVIKSGNIQILE